MLSSRGQFRKKSIPTLNAPETRVALSPINKTLVLNLKFAGFFVHLYKTAELTRGNKPILTIANLDNYHKSDHKNAEKKN